MDGASRDGGIAMSARFSNSTAVVGIGWTDFSKHSGRRVLDLAAEASLNAIDDAGLSAEDIDGLMTSCWSMKDTVAPNFLGHAIGVKDLRYQIFDNGGGRMACSTFGTAALAVHAGLCKNVLFYRAANGFSERAASARQQRDDIQWKTLYGEPHAAAEYGQFVAAFMDRYGVTSLDLAQIAVSQREHATLNTKAMMRTPITVQDHQDSPWIIEPFRLLDMCLRTDGAVALVITSAERARDSRHGPVYIKEFVGGGPIPYAPIWQISASKTAKVLYEGAGVSKDDIDFAELYDPFTGMCLMHMEGFGMADEGEGADWVRSGGNRLDGSTPVNTHGGLLSESYFNGYNHIIEAVQQLRPGGVIDDLCTLEHDYDRSRCRQVRDPKLGLVCGECGDSALLLEAA
jgi:acetyl-CoA acetyltransferase